jgi:hypothetical protein
MADTYAERFGQPPRISQHAMERMNTLGISPRQLAEALDREASPGVSPGTAHFVGRWVIAVVNEDGLIVTVYESR